MQHLIKNKIIKDFPIPFNNNYNFVGEYVYADDSKSYEYINILILELNT